MSKVGQVGKEGFREQVMMDELDLHARVQLSWVAGERKGVLVGGVAWTKRWRLGKWEWKTLWMVEVPGCKKKRWKKAKTNG